MEDVTEKIVLNWAWKDGGLAAGKAAEDKETGHNRIKRESRALGICNCLKINSVF